MTFQGAWIRTLALGALVALVALVSLASGCGTIGAIGNLEESAGKEAGRM